MANEIGGFYFVSLTGELQPPGPKVEPIQRPGINGTAWRYLGSKGDPFRMESIAFVTSQAYAKALIQNYRGSVSGSYTMYDALNNAWDVYVEDVKPSQPQYVSHAVWGNTNYGSGYIVKCVWTLRMTGG